MLLTITSSLLVMQSSFKALDNARNTTLASQIIQSEMERIRMLSWSRVQALNRNTQLDLETIFPQNTALEIKMLNQMKRVFTATRTITPLSAFSDEIVEINVSITWRGIDGITHNRSTNTRYCKNGLYSYYYTLPS